MGSRMVSSQHCPTGPSPLREYRHPWLLGWVTQCEYITANEVLVQLLSWRAWSVFFNGVCGEIGVAYDVFATVWRSIGMDYRTSPDDADELTKHAMRARRHRTRLQSKNESAGPFCVGDPCPQSVKEVSRKED